MVTDISLGGVLLRWVLLIYFLYHFILSQSVLLISVASQYQQRVLSHQGMAVFVSAQ